MTNRKMISILLPILALSLISVASSTAQSPPAPFAAPLQKGLVKKGPDGKLIVVRAEHGPTYPRFVNRMADNGIMTRQEAMRLYDLGGSFQATKRMNDSDLDWALGLIRSKPVKDTEENRGIRIRQVLLNVGGPVRGLPAAQREKLFRAIKPLLSDRNWWVRSSAALSAGGLGDKRLAPDLKAMSRDSNSIVRSMAATALRRLSTP